MWPCMHASRASKGHQQRAEYEKHRYGQPMMLVGISFPWELFQRQVGKPNALTCLITPIELQIALRPIIPMVMTDDIRVKYLADGIPAT